MVRVKFRFRFSGIGFLAFVTGSKWVRASARCSPLGSGARQADSQTLCLPRRRSDGCFPKSVGDSCIAGGFVFSTAGIARFLRKFRQIWLNGGFFRWGGVVGLPFPEAPTRRRQRLHGLVTAASCTLPVPQSDARDAGFRGRFVASLAALASLSAAPFMFDTRHLPLYPNTILTCIPSMCKI